MNKNVFSRALELVSTTFHFSLSILCGVCVCSTLTIMLVLSFQNAFENFQKLVVLKPTVLYVLFTLLFTYFFFFSNKENPVQQIGKQKFALQIGTKF